MNGTKRAVNFLSFSLSKVLAVIIAGTEHPNPIIIGINAFPDSPIFLISLSIIKATLAIYPLSSSNVIHIKSTKIIGNNTSIPPTPATIPSTISDLNQGELLESNSEINGIKLLSNKSESKSEMGCPTHEKVNWNISAISKIKIGYASTG
ncbi:hypothetical protein CNEONATNEC32_02440 [Clostridium neonatale]|nr:hypothetical protein CNEONATNEC32_02440 [Clostridium neonatale]